MEERHAALFNSMSRDSPRPDAEEHWNSLDDGLRVEPAVSIAPGGKRGYGEGLRNLAPHRIEQHAIKRALRPAGIEIDLNSAHSRHAGYLLQTGEKRRCLLLQREAGGDSIRTTGKNFGPGRRIRPWVRMANRTSPFCWIAAVPARKAIPAAGSRQSSNFQAAPKPKARFRGDPESVPFGPCYRLTAGTPRPRQKQGLNGEAFR